LATPPFKIQDLNVV